VFGIKQSEMFEIGFHDEDGEFNHRFRKKLARLKEPTVKKTIWIRFTLGTMSYLYSKLGCLSLTCDFLFIDVHSSAALSMIQPEMRAVLRRRKLMLKLWRKELNTRHNLRHHSFLKVLVSPRHTTLLHKAYVIHSSAVGTQPMICAKIQHMKRQEKDSQSVENVIE
ncbi:hypothetical protein Tco_0205049, partial [Tanacetum coccineum]